MFGHITVFSLRLFNDTLRLRLKRCCRSFWLSCRFEIYNRLRFWGLLSSGHLFLLPFLYVVGADGRHAFPALLRLALDSSSASELLHNARHLTVDHRVRPASAHLPRARFATFVTTWQRLPERVDVQDPARLVLTPTLALAMRVEGCAEHAARILVRSVVLLITNNARRDDEELRGDQLEARGQREEPRVKSALGLSLGECGAVVEVGMREDTPEAAGEGGEVSVRGRWDGQTRGEVAGRVEE